MSNISKIQVGDTTYNIKDAEAERIVIKNSSGTIANFDDGIEAPAANAKVKIEPVQDLHGYDHPWPAGGGKNKLPLNINIIKTLNTNGTWSENIYTNNGITWTINIDANENIIGFTANGTASKNSVFYLYNFTKAEFLSLVGDSIYKFYGCPAGGSATTYYLRMSPNRNISANSSSDYGTGNNTTINATSLNESDTIIRMYANVDSGNTVSELKFKPIFIPQSETDSTFEPYSNICPIEGWTGVKVMRTGKNLLNLTNRYIAGSGITWTIQDNGTIIANGNSSEHGYIAIEFKLPSGKYKFNGCPDNGAVGSKYDIFVWDVTDKKRATKWDGISNSDSSINYTNFKEILISDTNRYELRCRVSANYTANNLVYKPMIVKADETDTAYEPYQGDTYDISFGEAGTVYGGSLDVPSGKLTVDRATISLVGGNEATYVGNGSSNGTTRGLVTISDKKIGLSNFISDIFRIGINEPFVAYTMEGRITSNKIEFRLPDSIANNSTAIQAWFASNHTQLIYELATPITYQLTPTEVTTLLGQNNIWADTGDTSVNYWKNKLIAESIPSMALFINALNNLDDLGMKRYGVLGYGQSITELTRTFDAVGMVAEVGTDGDNSGVRNDFDNAVPFMRRKCVGEWTLEDGHAVFHVKAYYGDADYIEDGSMGDYVAVECPRCYYYRNGEHLIISAHQYPGYRPFDIFCRNHNPADTMPFVYLPAYALALKDGKAVSLPGLENENGSWDYLLGKARTYADGALGNKAMMLPASVAFYEEALMTVEFATTNLQNIMRSVCDMRSNANTQCKFLDQTHILVTDWEQAAQTSIAGWNANWRIAGDYISVIPEDISDIHDGRYRATHKIISVTRCDENGTASTSGKYSKLEVQDLGKNYWTYDYTGATNYKLGGRPHFTGETNSVSTPSGSPISLTDGHHVMKYRWRENVYGNQYWNSADVFIMRVGTDDSDYYLDWYYLNDPEIVDTFNNNSRPNATDLTSENFTKLDLITPHEKCVNHFIKSKKFSDLYPDIWIPNETTDGSSATTFFCDRCYLLVTSNTIRSLRFGGDWTTNISAGPSLLYAYSVVSSGNTSFGGHLFIKQG